jgi:putative transposase
MPWYRGLFVPGGTYFFTANLANRSERLFTENIEALREAYAYVVARHPFETVAIVVLPDHLHCVWTLPPDDKDFPMRWRLLKSRFSHAISGDRPGRRKGERGVWQRRYWEHLIRDDDDLISHVNYIHGNPVKHGLVTDTDDWRHSSWHRWRRDYAASLPPMPDEWRPVGERAESSES